MRGVLVLAMTTYLINIIFSRKVQAIYSCAILSFLIVLCFFYIHVIGL